MTVSYRHAVHAAALLAYLSSVIVGGLHHHEHDEASAIHHSDNSSIHHSDNSSSPLAAATIQSSAPIVSTHDDTDGCTLCTALHQAKALPIAISPMIGSALTGEAGSLPVESSIASIALIH